MLNNKWELTNWAQNTKHKNTNWHQNLSQKSSKNPIFVVRKWAPQEVVLFLTLEVVPKLTLERPKSGTKTNSPAYIYIYLSLSPLSSPLSIYISLSIVVFLSLSHFLFLPSFVLSFVSLYLSISRCLSLSLSYVFKSQLSRIIYVTWSGHSA